MTDASEPADARASTGPGPLLPTFPRLVIAAPHGRSGKTTFTLGLAAALAARGLVVQPFKKGPDYIDPSWLSAAAGRPCRNLDPFFMPTPAALRAAFLKGASPDVSLIEGNHGLYDSASGEDTGADGAGSTAALARLLAAPVLLVVSAARMGRSIAALVLGYQQFEPATRIAGVILNHVSQGRHEDKLRQAVERHCGIPVLGALPADAALTIPDRHLGLLPRVEDERHVPAIQACCTAVAQGCDLDAILALARSAPVLDGIEPTAQAETRSSGRRIAIFRDRAFSFYYHENLEALVETGAQLLTVDALHDKDLPPADLLYIGGGFPEVFMEALSANVGLRHAVRSAAAAGMPIYAECGGLMYLSRFVRWGRRHAEMAGVLPMDVEVVDKPQGHGYVLAEVTEQNPFFSLGARLRGHEFHHSRIVAVPADLTLAYTLKRGHGIADARDGFVYRNVLASYTHLHVAGAPTWPTALLRA